MKLETKLDSACHFFECFRSGAYLVQLRLDWTEIGANGHPMLNADFLDPVTLKHDHSMRHHRAHTTTSADSDERTYEWRFEEAHRRFTVAVTWSAIGFASASATAFAEGRAVRAQPSGEGCG